MVWGRRFFAGFVYVLVSVVVGGLSFFWLFVVVFVGFTHSPVPKVTDVLAVLAPDLAVDAPDRNPPRLSGKARPTSPTPRGEGAACVTASIVVSTKLTLK